MKIQYYDIVKRPENELLKQIVNSCLRSDFHAFFEDVAVSALWYMHSYILYTLWILEHFISEIKLEFLHERACNCSKNEIPCAMLIYIVLIFSVSIILTSSILCFRYILRV